MDAVGDLELLLYCDLGNRDSKLAIPSWVPDWGSMERIAMPFPPAFADCLWPSEVQRSKPEDDRTLKAKGVQMDTVMEVIELHFSDARYLRWQDVLELQRVANCSNLTDMYVGSGMLVDALFRTFNAGFYRERYDPPVASLLSEKEGRFAFSKLMECTSTCFRHDIRGNTKIRRYLSQVLYYMKGRSFVVTEGGSIGIAPKATRPGDWVCILLGCNIPLVIRPVERGNSIQTYTTDEKEISRFQIVGATYINTAMTGEAFLGPLPDHYRLVIKLDSGKQCFRMSFFNKHTSKTQWADPRWKDVLGEKYEELLKIKDLNEKDRKTVWEREALKARGTELRWFDFV
ncbi:hypothetical protein MMC13_005558 [Lambiella insularis]|nr:hypothetical protein [Lambiella insularis]